MEFRLDGEPAGEDRRKSYLERFIHGAIYAARPDVCSVVHSHSHSVIPFSVTQAALRPLLHSSAVIGAEVPVWDTREAFGDSSLLVSNLAMGEDLAKRLGHGSAALMRGHGSTVVGRSLREAVYTAVYLEVNASLQLKAAPLGPIEFLSVGEINIIRTRLAEAKPGEGYDRSWEYWCRRAGVAYRPST